MNDLAKCFLARAQNSSSILKQSSIHAWPSPGILHGVVVRPECLGPFILRGVVRPGREDGLEPFAGGGVQRVHEGAG